MGRAKLGGITFLMFIMAMRVSRSSSRRHRAVLGETPTSLAKSAMVSDSGLCLFPAEDFCPSPTPRTSANFRKAMAQDDGPICLRLIFRGKSESSVVGLVPASLGRFTRLKRVLGRGNSVGLLAALIEKGRRPVLHRGEGRRPPLCIGNPLLFSSS